MIGLGFIYKMFSKNRQILKTEVTQTYDQYWNTRFLPRKRFLPNYPIPPPVECRVSSGNSEAISGFISVLISGEI